MEKMNQVSVTEFMSKSKEEMYDMAVEMVEKYNRLVDICNDSAERIAELIERHVNKVDELEKEVNKWKDLAKMNRDTICDQYGVCEEFKKRITELVKELADCKVKIRHQKENLDGINKTLEIRTKENERLIKVKNNQEKEIEAHEAENARLSERIMKLKDTITELTHDIDNYQYWNKKLSNDHVDEIAKKNKEIEKLKVDLIHEREKNEKLARAHAELENDMRKSYTDIISQSKTICNLKKELDICGHEVRFYKDRMNTLYEEKIEKEDDHGRAGFKKYIEWLVKEEETKFEESWKARLNEELEAIFKEKEETEVKCRKPDECYCPFIDECCRKPENFDCAFKDDIPYGSDSIE